MTQAELCFDAPPPRTWRDGCQHDPPCASSQAHEWALIADEKARMQGAA